MKSMLTISKTLPEPIPNEFDRSLALSGWIPIRRLGRMETWFW